MDLVENEKTRDPVPTPGKQSRNTLLIIFLKKNILHFATAGISLKSALDAVDQFEFKKPQINTQHLRLQLNLWGH